MLQFELYKAKYILVKLPLSNSKDSLTFYFDTGAASTMLNKNVAHKLGLKANHSKNVKGAGGDKKYEMIINQKVKLTENDSIDGVNFILEDLTALREALGKNYDGIIGLDILKNYQTEINFRSQKITLYKSEELLDLQGYSEQPYTFKNQIVSPIEIKDIEGNFVIANVVEKSDAYKKGLRAGQKIISMNGITAKEVQTYRYMLKKENSTVKINYIDQESKIKKIRVKLKKML